MEGRFCYVLTEPGSLFPCVQSCQVNQLLTKKVTLWNMQKLAEIVLVSWKFLEQLQHVVQQNMPPGWLTLKIFWALGGDPEIDPEHIGGITYCHCPMKIMHVQIWWFKCAKCARAQKHGIVKLADAFSPSFHHLWKLPPSVSFNSSHYRKCAAGVRADSSTCAEWKVNCSIKCALSVVTSRLLVRASLLPFLETAVSPSCSFSAASNPSSLSAGLSWLENRNN